MQKVTSTMNFKKLRVQRFRNECSVRSTKTLTVLVIENPGIQLTEDGTLKSEELRIQAKVAKIDIKTFVQTFLFPEWNPQVEIENATN